MKTFLFCLVLTAIFHVSPQSAPVTFEEEALQTRLVVAFSSSRPAVRLRQLISALQSPRETIPVFEKRTGPEQRVPVWQVMHVLDLMPDHLRQESRFIDEHDTGGLHVIRLRAMETGSTKSPAQGYFETLAKEMRGDATTPFTEFELIYTPQGFLAAIVPHVTRRDDYTTNLRFFDFSAFTEALPTMNAADRLNRWREIAASTSRTQDLVTDYLAKKTKQDPKINYWTVGGDSKSGPYYVIERDKNEKVWHAWRSIEFSPADAVRVLPLPNPDKEQVIVPLFPTVYPVGNWKKWHQDEDYRNALRGDEFNLQPNQRMLLMGPGTGWEAWSMALVTHAVIDVIGLNPLEVANTLSTAALADIKVRAQVANNVIGTDGRWRFPKQQFDRMAWNAMSPILKGEDLLYWKGSTLAHHWDGDIGGQVLRRFIQGARPLLKGDGKLLLWLFPSDSNGFNDAAVIASLNEILEGRRSNVPAWKNIALMTHQELQRGVFLLTPHPWRTSVVRGTLTRASLEIDRLLKRFSHEKPSMPEPVTPHLSRFYRPAVDPNA